MGNNDLKEKTPDFSGVVSSGEWISYLDGIQTLK
jgi:hypothetical protein